MQYYERTSDGGQHFVDTAGRGIQERGISRAPEKPSYPGTQLSARIDYFCTIFRNLTMATKNKIEYRIM